jgi:hypothetical protein
MDRGAERDRVAGMKKNTTIQAGQKLTARSGYDWGCVFTADVLDRKGAFATVKAQGNTRRVKVFADESGEYIFALGRYSMAPVFRAK